MRKREMKDWVLANLLEKKTFKIPDFQREYAWTKSQVEDLFDDTLLISQVGTKDYFFGPMVFKFSFDRQQVIDGQQRLATISILYAIVGDLIKKYDLENEVKKLDPKFKSNIDNYLETGGGDIRLEINSQNQDLFEKLIIEIDEPEKKIEKIEKTKPKTSNLALFVAYKTLKRKFGSEIKKIQSELNKEKRKIREDSKVIREKITQINKGINDNSKKISQNNIEIKKLRSKIKKLPDPSDKKSLKLFEANNIQLQRALQKLDSEKNTENSEKDKKSDQYKVKEKEFKPKIADFLHRFVNALSSFMIIVIEAQSTEAHQIFETLNERGKPLTQSDLAKNFIIMHAENDDDLEKKFSKNWNGMQENVSPHKPDDFLVAYCRSEYGKTSTTGYYRKIKIKNPDGEKVKKLSQQLLDNSLIYKKIIHPDDISYWNRLSIVESLTGLKNLDSTVFYPIILLSKSQNLKNDEIEKLAKMCVSMFVRHKTIGGEHAGPLDTLTIDVCKEIRKNSKLTDDIVKAFKDKLSSKTKFEKDFSGASIKENSIAKYLIKEIYHKKEGGAIDVPKNFELEHIIPQSVFDNWDDATGDTLKWKNHMMNEGLSKEDVYRLGNMALLSELDNQRCSDKWFDYKKTIYATYQSWTLTKNIDSLPTKKWFEDREQDFATLASEIWKIE